MLQLSTTGHHKNCLKFSFKPRLARILDLLPFDWCPALFNTTKVPSIQIKIFKNSNSPLLKRKWTRRPPRRARASIKGDIASKLSNRASGHANAGWRAPVCQMSSPSLAMSSNEESPKGSSDNNASLNSWHQLAIE